MQFKELTIKKIDELEKMLENEQEKLRQLNFKVAQKQLKNIRQIRDHKHFIAKILTAINQLKKDK